MGLMNVNLELNLFLILKIVFKLTKGRMSPINVDLLKVKISINKGGKFEYLFWKLYLAELL